MQPSTIPQPNVKAIVIFYVLACAISWPFFFWRDVFPESWATAQVPSRMLNLFIMWGPGIAALIVFRLFKGSHERQISFSGASLPKSLMFFFFPYLIWAMLLWINPDKNTIAPQYLLQLLPFGFLMILGEELGWRGFLQDALRPLKAWKRWLILGLMWEFWHFTRGLVSGAFPQILLRKMILLLSVLLLTVIIGRLTDRTKSLMVAITLHSWVNIQFEFPHFNTLLAGGISLLIWAVLIWKWDASN
jgi:membrane protease YdiL (CAAX protease family)